tara:strand:- start:680 stop:781 length:102 start_codon:yes stop_codon:yes gene_type:complete
MGEGKGAEMLSSSLSSPGNEDGKTRSGLRDRWR